MSHPDGGIAEGDFFTDLLVSGHAGDDTALAAFTAGGWHRDAGWFRSQQSELSDLICEVLWDRTLTNADDEDRERYRARIHAEIGRLMDRSEAANAVETQTRTAARPAATGKTDKVVPPARQLSLLP